MRPTATRPRIAHVVATLGLLLCVTAYAQQLSSEASKSVAKAAASPVHSIVLPQFPPDIADGPNKETYQQKCLLCHSARYVSMQPRFSKTVWQSEVKKMVDVYGAPISEADQALIVEYLVAVKGAEASAAPTAAPK